MLAFANVGLSAGFFGPISVLLAKQAETLDAANKEQVLAVVAGVGALVSAIAMPLAGAFSDRTTSRLGRRVPWLLGGAVGGGLALMLLSVAPNVAVMLLAWCLAQALLNGMNAAITTMIPDQVPSNRRGRIGGIVAVAQTVGILTGTGIAAATGNITVGYLMIAVFVVVSAVPIALRSRDAVLPRVARPPLELRAFLSSLWVSPREHPDFAWAWLTRLLVNLGNALALLYLLYFLQDVVGYSSDEADDHVFVLTAIYAATVVLTTVVFGAWSDRIGRRKVFVIWSGMVSGAASLLLGVGQSWPAAVAAAVVLGCAYGIYTAVDFALITEVLPAAVDRAKDLGVINIANSLPQVLAPVLAGDPAVRGQGARRRGGPGRLGVLGRLPDRLRARLPGERPRLGLRDPHPRGALTAAGMTTRRQGFWTDVTLQGTYEPSTREWVREQVEAYEASGGAEANILRGRPEWPIVVITSIGARSGKLRKNPVMRVEKDGVYAAVASQGGSPTHPTWYYNFLANPHVDLQDGPEPHEYVARLAEGAEREEWWERCVALYPPYADYQERTDREIPVFLLERVGLSSARRDDHRFVGHGGHRSRR